MSAQSGSNNAAQAMQQELEQLRRIQDSIAFRDIHSDVAQLDQLLVNLPGKLRAIRSGGYRYKNFLEEQAHNLASDWQNQHNQVRQRLLEKQSALQIEASNIHTIHSRGATAGVILTTLENHTNSAAQYLKSLYSQAQETAQRLDKQVNDITWTLQQMGEASFKLLPAEAPVEAVSARWKNPEVKDGLGGVLFLTDQRLIFEQKEEIATKKVLFITTAKQKVQELKWAIPLDEVQDAQGSKRGFLNKDDFLTITTSSGKPFQAADIHLKGESGDAWREHIQHASRGALASEKVGAPGAGFQAVAAALAADPPAGVIEYPHAPEDELAARFPQGGGSLACSTGTRLNVGENQQAVLFSSGRFFDWLNPGAHTLSPSDTPLLASAPGFSTTSIPVQVYFVKTLQFRDISWGTIAPIAVKAEGTASGVVNLKAYGKYSFVIGDPLLFLSHLPGDRIPFTLAEMRAYIVLLVAEAINDLLTRQIRQVSDLIYLTGEVSPAIITQVREKAASRGVNLFQFTVEAINAEEF